MRSEQNQKLRFRNLRQIMKNWWEESKKLNKCWSKRMKIWRVLKTWEKKRML